MIKNVIIKMILGIIFTFLGVFFSNLYFSSHPLFGFPYIGQILISLLVGTIGAFLLPLLFSLIARWLRHTIFTAVSETFSQLPKRLPQREKEDKESYGEQVVLDTSAIIDGRAIDVIRLGFLPCRILVPRFILHELQHVADSTDVLKRNRGRRGLDMLDEIMKNPLASIRIIDRDYSNIKAIDAKLVRLARDIKAKIVTTDYNLNKVARVSGVQVLNVNELGNALKTIVLPGEQLKIKVIQEGKELNQGVGYLPDGTMVVVEEGGSLIGQTIEATVSRIFQTAAGKMIFVQIQQQK